MMGENERIRGWARKEAVEAGKLLDELDLRVAEARSALRRALAKLAAGESAGSIGTACASDLDMVASLASRALERHSLALSISYELESLS